MPASPVSTSVTLEPVDRATRLALVFIMLIAAVLRFYALGRAPLWLDEQCQLSVAQTDSAESFWRVSGSLGPIGRLSYLDSWLVWHLGGHSRALFRLPSVLWGLATVALLFELGRRWFSANVGLVSAGLLAVCGIHIQYSREARGYAALVFFTVLFAWQLDRFLIIPTRRNNLILILIAAWAAQLHPVFWAAALPLVLVNLIADARRWHRAAEVASALFVVYALYILTRLDMGDLAPAVTVHTDGFFTLAIPIYKALLGGYWGLPSYVIFLCAITGVGIGLAQKSTRRVTCCILAITLAAAAPIVLSYTKGMWITARYSLFAVPFLMLAAAHGFVLFLRRIPCKELHIAAASILLALLLLLGMPLQNRSPYDLERFKESWADWPTLER